MTNYYELRIKINPEMEDIISEICFENLPCEGVVLAEETYKDLEMVATTEGTLRVFLTESLQQENVILNLFKDLATSKSEIENILTSQRKLLKSRGFTDEELGSWDFTLEEKQNEDWSKKWKEKWDVTHVTDRITVVPDWLEYTPHREDEVIIRLEPGCAFGTGTHQTTQLCMKAIEKYMPQNAEVADIGTGSGILAVCAIKFGAKSAYGCDNDPTVIDVAKENAEKNGINVYPPLEGGITRHCEECNDEAIQNPTPAHNDKICTFELNTADKITKQFDFVMANILHNVLFEIMGDLKAIMKDGAYLSLSGILDEKKRVVLEAINRENLKIVEEIHQDQWTSFIVKK